MAVSTASAQQTNTSPYRASWALDVPVSLGGGGLLATSYVLKKRKPLLTQSEINALRVSDIPRFDRFATKNWSKKAQLASDVFMFSAPLYPLSLLADKQIRKDADMLALITFETFLVNAALTGMVKETVRRKRPFLYNPNVGEEIKLNNRDATSSFFSGHTSVNASMAFMTAKIYADYHPGSKWKPAVWTTAAVFPAITGFLRVKGGKHYLSDVLVGYLVGAAVGVLVPELHRRAAR